jgi:hypothetical protein
MGGTKVQQQGIPRLTQLPSLITIRGMVVDGDGFFEFPFKEVILIE